jgi:hypothetical protein
VLPPLLRSPPPVSSIQVISYSLFGDQISGALLVQSGDLQSSNDVLRQINEKRFSSVWSRAHYSRGGVFRHLCSFLSSGFSYRKSRVAFDAFFMLAPLFCHPKLAIPNDQTRGRFEKGYYFGSCFSWVRGFGPGRRRNVFSPCANRMWSLSAGGITGWFARFIWRAPGSPSPFWSGAVSWAAPRSRRNSRRAFAIPWPVTRFRCWRRK